MSEPQDEEQAGSAEDESRNEEHDRDEEIREGIAEDNAVERAIGGGNEDRL